MLCKDGYFPKEKMHGCWFADNGIYTCSKHEFCIDESGGCGGSNYYGADLYTWLTDGADLINFGFTPRECDAETRECVPTFGFYAMWILPAVGLCLLVVAAMWWRERAVLLQLQAASKEPCAVARRQLSWQQRWLLDRQLTHQLIEGGTGEAGLRTQGAFGPVPEDMWLKVAMKLAGVLLWLQWGLWFWVFFMLMLSGWFGPAIGELLYRALLHCAFGFS